MNLSKSLTISRRLGITALSVFFFAATGITLVAAIPFLFPNGLLEPIWELNPRAHVGLAAIGIWAPLLFFVVAFACALAAIGMWQGARWGYVMAIAILTINSLADLFNVFKKGAEGDNRNTDRHPLSGIPIQSKGETVIQMADRSYLGQLPLLR